MHDWMPLPGFPRYAATRDGSVRGPSGKVLRPFPYEPRNPRVLAVNVYRDGEMVRITVSRIRRLMVAA